MHNLCKKKERGWALITESDAEQKFLYPISYSKAPMTLDCFDSKILKKHFLKKIEIDKGQKRYNYYPDYVVLFRGLPVIVVEAKTPKSHYPVASTRLGYMHWN